MSEQDECIDRLCRAAQNGDLEIVKRAIAEGWPLSTPHHKTRSTPMRVALDNEKFEIIEMLLAAGAPLTGPDHELLSVAVRRGHTACVQTLLAGGADINARLLDGQTILSHFCENVLIEFFPQHIEIARLLLDAGASTEYPEQPDNTPLLLAAAVGSTELVALLLDHGARIDVVNSYGETACDRALAMNAVGCARYLMKRRAPITKPNHWFVRIADMLDQGNDEAVLRLIDNPGFGGQTSVSQKVFDTLGDDFRMRIRQCDAIHLDGYRKCLGGRVADEVAARTMRDSAPEAFSASPVRRARLSGVL